MNYIAEYVGTFNNIAVSKRVKKVYEKLLDEINNPKQWLFDEEKANRPIEFIEQFCRHSKGEYGGKPVKLELFQKAYISALFGFVNNEGLRKYKETMFLIARKNGKSTLLSCISLFMLVADLECGAEIFSVASKKDQAKIVFNEAVNMVKQSPALSKHLKKRKSDIYFPLTFSKFEALASESSTLDGLNSHAVIIDELHCIRDRNLYEVMKQSMSARRQPLLIMITTSGTVRECIYDDMYEYACNIVDGQIEDDRFLPILYELDDTLEWTDPNMWVKANPGLGTIKKLDDLQEKVERAKVNPKDLPGILCKDFNIRNTVAGAWLTFEECNNTETFTIEDIKNSYAIGSTDLSSTTDLSCATLLVEKYEKLYCLQQYFLPEELLERRTKEDKIPYDKWYIRGLLTLCEGNKVKYSDVTAWFVRMFKQYEIRPLWIYYDPWNSQYWVEEMKDTGFEMEVCRQGCQTLSTPMKELEAELKGKRINYNNNPILKWCLTNTSVKIDENGNIRPIKGKNHRQRIDGAVSLLIAFTGYCTKRADYQTYIKG